MKNNNNIKFISQGSFGCLFKPAITCDGMIDKSIKYITKIQKNKNNSKQELYIGSIIKNISNFPLYFAPLLDSCEVDIGNYIDSEFQKCDFIDKPSDMQQNMSFEINKLMFIGNETLHIYFINLIKQNNMKKFIIKFFSNFLHLIDGYHKLSNEGIVHFDCKLDNIVCKSNGLPIIIDFGISFNINDLLSNNKLIKNTFYNYAPSYNTWCIDIHIINYMVQYIGSNVDSIPDLLAIPVSIETICNCINDVFTSKNSIVKLLSADEFNKYKNNLIAYFSNIINSKGNKWGYIYENLIDNYKSWDLYSVFIIYLHLFYGLQIDSYSDNFTSLSFLKNEFIKFFTTMPNERPSHNCIIQHFKQNLQVISSEEFNLIQTHIHTYTNDNIINITNSIQNITKES